MTQAEKLQKIAENQEKVYEAGYNKAEADVSILNDKLEQALYGIDIGGKSFYDELWDNITDNGERQGYGQAFSGWGSEYIRPNRKIYPLTKSSCNQTFNGCKKLKKIESNYFDFSKKERGDSNVTGYYYTFYNCTDLEEIEDIGIGPDFDFVNTFNCQKLHTISKIRVDEQTKFSNTFNYAYQLVNIEFDGIIGQNNLNLRWSSKLSKRSILSIINALSPDTTGFTVQLSEKAIKTAFETSPGLNNGESSQEWLSLIDTKKNWTISLE